MCPVPSAFVRLRAPAFVSALLLGVLAAGPVSARPAGDAAPRPESSVREVERGDTLEGLLRELGFEDELLVETILGFSAEFDPDHLRPGQRLEVVWSDGSPRHPERITLTLGEETIELDTSGVYRTAATPEPEPELEWAERAVRVTVEKTVISALDSVGAPTSLGLDIAANLGGMVDFRRDLRGGETIEVLYREAILPDGEPAGRAELRYARVEIGGRVLEIARQADGVTPVQVFEDGEAVRMSAMPVVGARISSHFGSRKHPIHGTVRMHSGVDFAAKQGAAVHASAPGRVSFVGTRGGYGKVVEIEHGSEMSTRYAHLSRFADGLEAGQHVEAGHPIGDVGATGLATGPHLHYDVRYAGDPVDPLSDERIAALAGPESAEPVQAVLRSLRDACARALDSEADA